MLINYGLSFVEQLTARNEVIANNGARGRGQDTDVKPRSNSSPEGLSTIATEKRVSRQEKRETLVLQVSLASFQKPMMHDNNQASRRCRLQQASQKGRAGRACLGTDAPFHEAGW